MSVRHVGAAWLVYAGVAVLILVPVVSRLIDTPYFIILVARILVFALAAAALNLVLGFGGMASFGHSLFISIGAYSVGISDYFGVSSGWVHLGFALGVSALAAAATGAVALRTRGIGFIMITLAFAQMFYFLGISLKEFGGDDGLPIKVGSRFGSVALKDPLVLYYATLILLALVVYGSYRLYHSRFGLTLRGCMINEDRMKALGFDTMSYKLVAYVLSGSLTGIAGFMLANLTLFASPSYAGWVVSGDLMLMLVIGGIGTIIGPVVGTFVYMLAEELLKRVTDHYLGFVGVIVVLVALFARRGLWGMLQRDER